MREKIDCRLDRKVYHANGAFLDELIRLKMAFYSMDHSFSGNLSFFLQCDYYAFYLLKKLFEKKPTDNLFYTVW